MSPQPPYIIQPFLGIAEPLSALSHLFAAAVFAFLAYLLIQRSRGDGPRIRAIKLYACSVVALLLVSGVYHLFARELLVRDIMQRIDHATIFVLIASTFTAVHTVLLEGIWRSGIIALVWSLAAIGMFISLAFLNTVPESVCLVFYLGLGWLGLISFALIWRRFGFLFVLPLALGAFAYTLGAIIDFLRAPVLVSGVIGPHELFHVAVLAGIGFHWKFVSSFVHRAVAQCPETRVFQLVVSE